MKSTIARFLGPRASSAPSLAGSRNSSPSVKIFDAIPRPLRFCCPPPHTHAHNPSCSASPVPRRYVKAGSAEGETQCPFSQTVRMVLHEKDIEYKLTPIASDDKPVWLVNEFGGLTPVLEHDGEKCVRVLGSAVVRCRPSRARTLLLSLSPPSTDGPSGRRSIAFVRSFVRVAFAAVRTRDSSSKTTRARLGSAARRLLPPRAARRVAAYTPDSDSDDSDSTIVDDVRASDGAGAAGTPSRSRSASTSTSSSRTRRSAAARMLRRRRSRRRAASSRRSRPTSR